MTVKRCGLIGCTIVLFVQLQTLAKDDALPSDGFLEYLATLVDQDGEWVDPLELEDLPDEEPDMNAKHERTDTDAQHAEETP